MIGDVRRRALHRYRTRTRCRSCHRGGRRQAGVGDVVLGAERLPLLARDAAGLLDVRCAITSAPWRSRAARADDIAGSGVIRHPRQPQSPIQAPGRDVRHQRAFDPSAATRPSLLSENAGASLMAHSLCRPAAREGSGDHSSLLAICRSLPNSTATVNQRAVDPARRDPPRAAAASSSAHTRRCRRRPRTRTPSPPASRAGAATSSCRQAVDQQLDQDALRLVEPQPDP